MKAIHLLIGAAAAATVCFPLASSSEPDIRRDTSSPDANASLTATTRLVWADYDADGLADAFAFHHSGNAALFKNLGDGRFEDVTEPAALDGLAGLSQALFTDFDSDGQPDLFVLSASGDGRLLRNTGATFEDVSEHYAVDARGIVHAAWTDYDGDGRPDLVLETTAGHRLYRNLGSTFSAIDLPLARLAIGAATSLAPAASGESADDAPFAAPDATTHARSRPHAPRPRPAGDRGRDLEAGSGSTTIVGPGPPSLPMGFCASRILDQATTGCVEASSLPTLGALYPLGPELSIDAAGQVGLGTTAPLGQLELEELDLSLSSAALFEDDLVVEATDAVVGLYSPNVGFWGSAVALAEIDGAGALVDKWSMARTTSSTSSARLRFTYGTGASYANNNTVLTLDADGDVGIGTTTPIHPLAVQTSNESGSAASIQSFSSNNSSDALLVYHNGPGRAISASTAQGPEAIRATGTTTGVYASGASGGYGLEAVNLQGSAIYASTGSSGGFLPALRVETASGGPAIEARSSHADDIAGSFLGELWVGIEGGFGIGVPKVRIDADSGSAGEMFMVDGAGTTTVEIESSEGTGANGAQIVLRDSNGVATIVLDAQQGTSGRITTEVLSITGGADLVESFDTGTDPCPPGSVVVIDPERPGELALSTRAYDTRVAGIVSGAGDVRPGLHMGQEGVASGDTPVALSGRVYVRCSTENGAIVPGDLLTSASLAGHAMKATDRERAFGAVLGKAMTSLDAETGLVLVLVGLQ